MPSHRNVREPITLIAPPRCGTGLISGIFGNHPSFQVCGETLNLLVGTYTGAVYSHYCDGDLPLYPHYEFIDRGIRSVDAVHGALVNALPSILPCWMHKPIGMATLMAWDRLPESMAEGENPQHPRKFLWQMFKTCFPNAQYATVLRNPFDVALSARRRVDDPFITEEGIWEVMAEVYDFLSCEDSCPVLVIDYDRLTRENEGYTREILERLGIQWHPNVLNAFGETYSALHTKARDEDEGYHHLCIDYMLQKDNLARIQRFWRRYGHDLAVPEVIAQRLAEVSAAPASEPAPVVAAAVVTDGATRARIRSHSVSRMDGKSMPRPIKVTIIGAGSGAGTTMVRDLLQISGAAGGEIVLVDIDAERLKLAYDVAGHIRDGLGGENWVISATVDRHEALPGSYYVVITIEVNGQQSVRHDYDIPLRYGIDQCIGDTAGPGGIFKGLRTAPAMFDIMADVEELCPAAKVFNYTNPMSILCLAVARRSPVPMYGLCHSVQLTSELLAKRAGVPVAEMEWACAGVNHLAWFTELRHGGVDLYPRLIEAARRDIEGGDGAAPTDLVRKDLMCQFGAFPTESTGHVSEYLPYYRKRKDLIARFCGSGYDGESGFYAAKWPGWRKLADSRRRELVAQKHTVQPGRSLEYVTYIIEALEKGLPYTFHATVPNRGLDGRPLVSNLPAECCVEVACTTDGQAIIPIEFGALPSQLASLCASHAFMYDLAATACLERSLGAAIWALLIDPLSAAVCSPGEIRSMALEMFEAEREYLEGYKL